MYQCKARLFLTIICLIISCVYYTAYAQWENLRFSHLSINEGLSQSAALCITQDNNGFIWIGTSMGLNKFDGYKFTGYTSKDDDPGSLSNDYLLTMVKTSDGMLWIGTEKGLNRLDPSQNRFTRFLHDPYDSTSLSNDIIQALSEDDSGSLWIGTENGLNRFMKGKNGFVRLTLASCSTDSRMCDNIRALCKSKSGAIWIGTYGGGLYRLDPYKQKFIHFPLDQYDSSGTGSTCILSVCEDASGILWIGTDGAGLYRFDIAGNVFTNIRKNAGNPEGISDDHINVIYEDRAGLLWIGTDNQGIDVFNRNRNIFQHYHNDPDEPAGLSNNRVKSIYEDSDGGIWFGTRGGGINLLVKENQKFVLYKPDPVKTNWLSYKAIWEIFEDSKGFFWIGTDGGGLNMFDREKNVFTTFTSNPDKKNCISDNTVYVVCEDNDGILWMATKAGGLNRFDPVTNQFKLYRCIPDDSATLSENWILSLIESPPGTLWLGTHGEGLNKFDVKSEKCIRYKNLPNDSLSLSSNKVWCISKSKTGLLWIGTFGGGLNKFDPLKNTFVRYQYDAKNLNTISSDFLSSLYEDSSGTLWIGTIKGLNKFNENNATFTRYTMEHGLPDMVIYDILEDNSSNLWLSTNRGLSQFNPRTQKFRNYDETDGLQGNEFNKGTAWKCKSGEMFFGGINGFNSFFPDSLIDNMHLPKVVITDFQLFGESVPIGKMADGRTILPRSISETREIVLSHKDNVFSFEFAALQFAAPGKNRYAYMMQGLEQKWNYTGTRRYVTYTRLPHGIYTFRVKASNNEGKWDEQGASLQITITPPVWKTWWFLALCSMCIIISAIAGYLILVHRLQRKKEEEERLKAIMDVNQVIEQGTAVVYRRGINSNEYDYMGANIKNITGYGVEEMSRKLWEKIVLKIETGGNLSPLSFDEITNRFQKGLMKRWICDYEIRTKSGDIRWVRDMMSVLHDKAGHHATILGMFFDITDRKQAEHKLATVSQLVQEKNLEMERDLNMAREIQTSFLSKYLHTFPQTSTRNECALEFSHIYLPTLQLAGDFFDVFAVSDHEVGVLICDVIGHGARASLLAFYLRGLIIELQPVAHDPSSFMMKLNTGLHSLSSQFSASLFATMCYLVVDITKGNLRYATAGHPMPYILRRTKATVEVLPGFNGNSGVALGLRTDVRYATFCNKIDEDDILVFFTDGVYEIWNKENQMFGRTNLCASLQRNLSIPFGKLLDTTLQDVLRFSMSDDLKDDVCLVGMHVRRIIRKE